MVLGELAPALDALAAHEGDAAVLASGDPGFFGIVRALRERGLPVTVLPAVSSVALAFARVGLAWDDAVVVSARTAGICGRHGQRVPGSPEGRGADRAWRGPGRGRRGPGRTGSGGSSSVST